MIDILLFGNPRILCDGKVVELSRRKSVALIAYLAVTGQRHGRERLATLFFPDNDNTQARAALRRLLADINNTPLSQVLESDRDVITLRQTPDVTVDVRRFNDLLTQNASPTALAEALQLYQDDFLAGFTLKASVDFDHWQAIQTQSLQHKLFGTLEKLSTHYIQANEMEQAIEVLRRWLSVDPLHDVAYQWLIQGYIATGQRQAALSQYETYSRIMAEELGIEPSTEIRDLVESLKQQSGVVGVHAMPRLRGTLPPRPTLLIGREQAIIDVRQRLQTDGEDAIGQCIIQGWPGIGKTTLTAALAHDVAFQESFPDGVLWTSLGQHPNLLAVLANWGRSLGFYELESVQNLEEATARLTAFLRDRRILLIIDDAWSVDHVMPLKVGGAHSRLIITTRLNDLARTLTSRPEEIYKLAILDEDESFTLLSALAPQCAHEHPTEMRELTRDLEGLPLALQVSGRLINAEMSMGWGIHDLLADLRSGRQLLEAEAPADRMELATETTPTIAILLKRSVERLPVEIQEQFALLGVFAPKPATFDIQAMCAVWQVKDARSTVRILVDRGLLEPVRGGQFQMHALLVMLAQSMFEGLR